MWVFMDALSCRTQWAAFGTSQPHVITEVEVRPHYNNGAAIKQMQCLTSLMSKPLTVVI